jgi:hypothetical protein
VQRRRFRHLCTGKSDAPLRAARAHECAEGARLAHCKAGNQINVRPEPAGSASKLVHHPVGGLVVYPRADIRDDPRNPNNREGRVSKGNPSCSEPTRLRLSSGGVILNRPCELTLETRIRSLWTEALRTIAISAVMSASSRCRILNRGMKEIHVHLRPTEGRKCYTAKRGE